MQERYPELNEPIIYNLHTDEFLVVIDGIESLENFKKLDHSNGDKLLYPENWRWYRDTNGFGIILAQGKDSGECTALFERACEPLVRDLIGNTLTE